MEILKYEIPSLERKEEAINYIKEFYEYNSEVNGSGGLDRYLDNYEGWLEKLEEDASRIPNEQKVPARTYFLVRESDNKIIGMINIRLALNENLRKLGGHIGYGIRPTERRKGYNKINLYLALLECQKYGIEEVLLTCNKDNLGSSKSMKTLGGKLIKEIYENERYHAYLQFYTINVNESIEKYKEEYEKYIKKEKVR